jgi:hypothetical protein
MPIQVPHTSPSAQQTLSQRVRVCCTRYSQTQHLGLLLLLPTLTTTSLPMHVTHTYIHTHAHVIPKFALTDAVMPPPQHL